MIHNISNLVEIQEFEQAVLLGTMRSPDGSVHEVRAIFEESEKFYTYREGVQIPTELARQITALAQLAIIITHSANVQGHPVEQQNFLHKLQAEGAILMKGSLVLEEDTVYNHCNLTQESLEATLETSNLAKESLRSAYEMLPHDQPVGLTGISEVIDKLMWHILYLEPPSTPENSSESSDEDSSSTSADSKKEDSIGEQMFMENHEKPADGVTFPFFPVEASASIASQEEEKADSSSSQEVSRVPSYLELVDNHQYTIEEIIGKTIDSEEPDLYVVIEPESLLNEEERGILHSFAPKLESTFFCKHYTALSFGCSTEAKRKAREYMDEIILWKDIAFKHFEDLTVEERKKIRDHQLTKKEQLLKHFLKVFQDNYQEIERTLRGF